MSEVDPAPLPQIDPARAIEVIVAFIREQIRDNPLPFFQELRAHRPIMRAGPVWLVARRRDVEEILHRETIFSVQSYSPRMAGVIGPFVLSLDVTPEYDRDISAMRLAVRREDLDIDGSFRYIKVWMIVGAAASDSGVVVVGLVPRHAPASDNDLSTVDEIVN